MQDSWADEQLRHGLTPSHFTFRRWQASQALLTDDGSEEDEDVDVDEDDMVIDGTKVDRSTTDNEHHGSGRQRWQTERGSVALSMLIAVVRRDYGVVKGGVGWDQEPGLLEHLFGPYTRFWRRRQGGQALRTRSSFHRKCGGEHSAVLLTHGEFARVLGSREGCDMIYRDEEGMF